MSRVRYLAALEGVAGRREPAPLLRPPRRLFPHEPPSLETVPSPQAAGESPPSAQPIVGVAEPVTAEPVERESGEADPPVLQLRPATPPAVVLPAEPPGERVLQPAAEDAPPRRQKPIRVLEAAPEARMPTRSTDPAPAARPEIRTKTASLGPERARADAGRRSPATLEPRRLEPPTAAPPDRVVVANRPVAEPVRAAGLHVGAIDVVVTPPPPAPSGPVPAASPPPAHQAPGPFASRDASTSRWFGLAQR